MYSSKTIRTGALAAMAAALLTAAPASAALPDAAVSCRAAIAKSYSKLVSTAVKTISACHKSRDKGDTSLTGTDCNDITAADTKGKFSGAVTKHESTVASSCAGVTVSDALIQPDGPEDYYTSCPVTCPGVPNPMTTMAHVATCQGCTAGAIAGDVMEASVGLPAQGSQSAENQKCRGAIGKGYGKYLSTFVKGATGCQGGQDQAGNNSLSFCELPANNDPKGKTAGSLTKAGDGLDKSCVGATLANMAGCATDSVSNLKSCTASLWDTASDDAFITTYEMEATGCPVTIRTQIRGGCSVNSDGPGCSSGGSTGTQLSVGWKGLAHAVDITDSYMLAGDVTCPGTEKGTCGTCTVDGVSTDSPQYSAFTRCVDAPWTACTNAFGTDPACPGSQACRYYLGPPLSISAGGTPTCTMNVINTDITGTANPDSGESSLLLDLRSIVHTGLSQTRPCPICRNDATPQDGVAGGTCLGGPRNNQPCDVQGFDLTFAPTNADNPTAGNSLDCPPSTGANISGSGLAIELPLTTGTSSKTAQDDCDGALAGSGASCFCGVCDDDGTVSCETDLDCQNLGLGNCGPGDGELRAPNNCSDGYCVSVPGLTDRGECSGGPAHCLDGPNVDDLCAVDSECSVCIGGFNDTQACADDSACGSACVGGSEAGTACTTDGDCGDVCDGGLDEGNPCTTDGDCANACTGGFNDGSACANNGDCANACVGGANDGASCTTGGDCADACAGGSNDGTACTSDADCSGSCTGGTNDGTVCFDDTPCTGGGTCQAIGTCSDTGACSDLGTCGDLGTCPNNGTCTNTGACDIHTCGQESDTDNYCSGVLFANGHGILPCTNDASCDSYISGSSNTDNWVCPGNDCGTCSVSTFRSCFLDPIEVTGTPDTSNPILAGTFCLPPSSNGSVNAATGSPGPGSVKTDALVELRY